MKKFIRYLSNVPGWHTPHRVVVIESDDWGSVRMPSQKTFDTLQKHGLDLTSGDYYRYNAFDTLAKPGDLAALFDILSSVRDSGGNGARFTAMSVVANPDFEKIREHGYTRYFFEPFPSTLERYYGNEASFGLWKEGIRDGIFRPQFHGREHLNVPMWLRDLRKGNKETLLAFEHGMWGFNKTQDPPGGHNYEYQAAFDMQSEADLDKMGPIIMEGLDLFEGLFGYRSLYFVPPNGFINNALNEFSAKGGIGFRSTAKIQHEPLGNGKHRMVLHYLGQKNRFGQRYITRNAHFEPNMGGRDWVDSCLHDIRTAFRLRKPAIISSHRTNYIGVHSTRNRDSSLDQLKALLGTIVKRWPDVHFLTTDRLGGLMNGDRL